MPELENLRGLLSYSLTQKIEPLLIVRGTNPTINRTKAGHIFPLLFFHALGEEFGGEGAQFRFPRFVGI